MIALNLTNLGSPMTEKNGKQEIWKWLAISALSILLGMGVQVLRTPAMPTDAVYEKELNLRVLELQQKIDTQTSEISALRQSVNQQSVDIAGIAAKVGVTAHPVTAPRSY
jgi:cell division protein FtsL